MVVVPAATPVTVPAALMVAAAGLLLLHTPPAAASVRVLEEPGHTIVAPLMVPADGTPVTVTTAVAPALPQLLVTL